MTFLKVVLFPLRVFKAIQKSFFDWLEKEPYLEARVFFIWVGGEENCYFNIYDFKCNC